MCKNCKLSEDSNDCCGECENCDCGTSSDLDVYKLCCEFKNELLNIACDLSNGTLEPNEAKELLTELVEDLRELSLQPCEDLTATELFNIGFIPSKYEDLWIIPRWIVPILNKEIIGIRLEDTAVELDKVDFELIDIHSLTIDSSSNTLPILVTDMYVMEDVIALDKAEKTASTTIAEHIIRQ